MKNWSVVFSLIWPEKKPGLASWRQSWRFWSLLLVAIIAWSAVAWLLVGNYESGLSDSYLRRERLLAERDLRMMTQGLAQNWEIADGVLSGLARQDAVLAALRRSNDNQVPGNGAARYASDQQLLALGRSLYGTVGDVKIIKSISLFDVHGIAIASSNVLSALSPVGGSYSDRGYFIGAMRGLRSVEFVNGRASNQPGLFLSLPVQSGGSIAGVIVAKLDATTLAPWINSADFFIADENGVIMLARDNDLVLKLLPVSKIDQINVADRVSLYKRQSFNSLPLKSEILADHPEIVTVEDRAVPVMLVTVPLAIGNSSAGVLQPLPRLSLLEQDRWRLSALAAFAGAMLLLLFFAMALRLHETSQRQKMAENEVAFHQSMIDAAALAIAVFADDGYCLAANDAMAKLFGTTRSEMSGHNFRSHELWLDSGLVGAADQVLALGASQRGNWHLSPGFGQDVWVEAAMKRFTYEGRNFLLVIFADVTEQRWRDAQTSQT